jgi:hypothetical protein
MCSVWRGGGNNKLFDGLFLFIKRSFEIHLKSSSDSKRLGMWATS